MSEGRRDEERCIDVSNGCTRRRTEKLREIEREKEKGSYVYKQRTGAKLY